MTSNFTLCKYNAKREIESVYYPYSESLEAMAPQRIVANAGKQEQTVNKDKNK